MKKQLLIASAVATTVLFTGCASIVDGGTQKINLQSKEKKNVTINGQVFQSPNTIELKRSSDDAILKIDGCADKTIDSNINGWFYGNIIIGGLLGSTTDYSTDAMWNYDAENINVDCK